MKFNSQKFIKKAILEIKKKIGNNKAIIALSGGVDSTTCATLGQKALGKNLVAIFIDDGLMRKKDKDEVLSISKKIGINIKVLNVADKFFATLKGKIDPEDKRIAFRNCFYQVLSQVAKKQKTRFLIQGTIATDIIETKKGVKTQHNVLSQIGINPKKYGFTIIEPLRQLYKPQVRKVAKVLNLPEKVFNRQPFPGPGLATRIIGEVNPEKVKIVRKASEIIEEELISLKPFQCFAVLLSDRATGIVNGQRIFGNIIVIRSVDSKDALLAKPTKIPWSILEKICQRIINEVPGVVKVLYDLTPKPPSTIEYI